MIDVSPRSLDDAPDLAEGWNKDAVRRPLWEHHLRKCYLCEQLVKLGHFDVEHRVPQKVSAELRHCWLNLFPAHSKCNGRRGAFPHPGGVLSPGLDRDIEGRLRQRIERTSACEIRARFEATNRDDLYAVNTAQELARLHDPDSATTDTSREATQELLDAIADRYIEVVYPLEHRALRARRRGHPDEDAEAQLRRALSRKAPFTMLIRSMVNASLRDLFD